MHCRRFRELPPTRRELLRGVAAGFGGVALTALLADEAFAGARPGSLAAPHHRPRARSVIFLYMDGGVSQIDSFDPKPRLAREHGQPFKMKIEPTQFNNNGATLQSPWQFAPHGQAGIPISELFPHVARSADDLCVIRSMTSAFSEHTNANYFLHTGLGLSGRPSMGAWVSYGLGSESSDLPGFVVVNGGLIPPGGIDNFASGFLPAAYQGSLFRPQSPALPNIQPLEPRPSLQKRKLALLRRLDEDVAARWGHPDELESAIANWELAFHMQAAVPELTDLSGEPASLRRDYGLEAQYAPTRTFAAECLIARRLVERGVRFVELTCPAVSGDRWDQHANLREGHSNNARAVDQPIGALLRDLKSRGLLDETLIVWAGEFGRTPFAQGSDGRDHNPFGFSIWLAGGGSRGGYIHGATDEYGYKVVEGKMQMYDLHATILHLLGVDHKRLTVRFGGRDMRLTDVHGEVVQELIAG
jgi:hypothetical protein